MGSEDCECDCLCACTCTSVLTSASESVALDLCYLLESASIATRNTVTRAGTYAPVLIAQGDELQPARIRARSHGLCEMLLPLFQLLLLLEFFAVHLDEGQHCRSVRPSGSASSCNCSCRGRSRSTRFSTFGLAIAADGEGPPEADVGDLVPGRVWARANDLLNNAPQRFRSLWHVSAIDRFLHR